MNRESLDENIPYLKGKEIVDVTQEALDSLRAKGLRVMKQTFSYPGQGLNDADRYEITGYVDRDGKYVNDASIQRGGMASGMIERRVSIVVSPDTGLVYLVHTSSSTGDPVKNGDSAGAARHLEEFCRD